MKIFLYFKNDKVFYLKNNEEVEISLNKIEDFINENKKAIFYLIFSKLDSYFRKLEFDFRNRKKINLILSQEIERKLPKSIDNFYFHLQFYYTEKDKTIVNVFAVEKERVNFLKNIFDKKKVKFYFLIDTLLIHQYLSEIIKEKQYIEIFLENKYLLVNLIENREISAVYSYFFENIRKDNILEIILPLITSKKYSLYFVGEKEFFDEIKLPEMKFLFKKSFLDILKETKNLQQVFLIPLNFTSRMISFNYIFYLIFLTFMTLIFTRPYFLKIEKEKKVEEINKKMEDIYKTLFPDTKKVINPLIQIKEKLTIGNNSIKVPFLEISIIKILEEITFLFPEDVKAEVEEVVISGKNVSLIGTVDNLKNLDKIKENLKNSKIFKNFDIADVSFTKENKVHFSLLLRMEE